MIFVKPSLSLNGIFHGIGRFFFQSNIFFGHGNILRVADILEGGIFLHAGDKKFVCQTLIKELDRLADSVAAAGQNHNGLGVRFGINRIMIDGISKQTQADEPKADN